MRTKVRKWGNSLAVRIPRSFAAEVGLDSETAVEVSVIDGKIVMTPIPSPEAELDRLLAMVTEENLHGEFLTGPAVGRESW